MIRRLAAVATAALSAFTLTAASAAEAKPAAGTAGTTLELASLTAGALPGGAVSLGTIGTFASTDQDTTLNALGGGQPYARAAVVLPAGELAASSDGQTEFGGRTVDLGAASVTAGELVATAGGDAASASIDALSADVAAILTDVRVALPASGAFSTVNAGSAMASNGAVLEGLSLGVGDLLPAELLAQLPLDVVLDLVDALPLDLGAVDVAGLLQQLRDLADAVDAVGQAQGAVDAAQDGVDGLAAQLRAADNALAAGRAAVDGARAQVGTARAALTTLTDQRTTLQAQQDAARSALPATLPTSSVCNLVPSTAGCSGLQQISQLDGQIAALQPQIDAATQAVDAAVAQLDAAEDAIPSLSEAVRRAQAAIDRAQATLDDLVATLNDLLDRLLDLVRDLQGIDLAALLEQALDGLAGQELIGVDRISVGVTSIADDNSSQASALCSVEGVRLLGTTTDAISCDDLQRTLGDADAAITDLLAALPLDAALPSDLVTVSGLTVTESPRDARAGSYTTAASEISALAIEVAPLDLAQVADGTLGELSSTVDALLAQVAAVPGVDLGTVRGALTDLVEQVDALPTGDLLGQLSVPGFAFKALGIRSGANHRAAAQSAPTTPTPTPPAVAPSNLTQTPAPAVAPGTVTAPPPAVRPAAQLPTTGGGLVGGLALLAAGGGGLVLRRRRRL